MDFKLTTVKTLHTYFLCRDEVRLYSAYFIICILSLLMMPRTNAQNQASLNKEIRTLDSLLFDVAFNTCDLSPLEDIISEDFEFYHDQGGITGSKNEFIESIKNNICGINYQPIRKLVEGTFKVYPLASNGVLYGAIQESVHRFFAREENKPEYFTSIARMTHLWLLENDEWKLKRVLSFDHSGEDRP